MIYFLTTSERLRVLHTNVLDCYYPGGSPPFGFYLSVGRKLPSVQDSHKIILATEQVLNPYNHARKSEEAKLAPRESTTLKWNTALVSAGPPADENK